MPTSSPPTRPSAIARRGALNCFVTFAGKEWHAAPGHVVNPKPSQLKPSQLKPFKLNGFGIVSTLLVVGVFLSGGGVVELRGYNRDREQVSKLKQYEIRME